MPPIEDELEAVARDWRAKADSATSGPWMISPEDGSIVTRDLYIKVKKDGKPWKRSKPFHKTIIYTLVPYLAENGDFMVHARNTPVAELLGRAAEEIRRLRAELEAYRTTEAGAGSSGD